MKKLNTKGFTLVESIVAVTVTTALVLIITNFMLRNVVQSALATARQNILVETQQSLDLAANDVRLSANADDDNRWPDAYSPGGPSNQYGWTSNSSTLVLATAAETTSGTIIFTDPMNYITEKNNLVYFVRNGTLFKRTIASPVAGNSRKTSCPLANVSSTCPADKEILHNITSLTFTYLDGNNQSVSPTNARSVEIHVTVTKKVYSTTLTSDYTTRMVFRND